LRIAIDCRFWGTKHTGLGRYTENLVLNLLEIDKVNRYFLFVSENNETMKQCNKATVLPLNTPHYSLKEQIIIPKILKEINPDLVHFPHFNVPILNNFPYLITIHDLIKHYSKGKETTTRNCWIYLLKYWGYKTVFTQAVGKAKKIIVPSKFVKRGLLKNYLLAEDKIEVIYEGVDNKLKAQSSKLKAKSQKSKLLNKYKIRRPYLLYVGNVYPHKNIRRLILAVKKINQTLIIVCSRDVFYQRLQQVVKEFKAEKFVKLTGYVTDKELNVLYAQAKAFINPSLMEGFGLPGLEAMQAGCPVVCSQIPTFKEVYDQAVVYFNPKNIDDIAEKILKVINFSDKERKELIKKGKNQASKYSWQKCAQETLQLYQSMDKSIIGR